MNPPPHFLALLDSSPEASRATSTGEGFPFTREGVKTSPPAFIGDGEPEPFDGPADDDAGEEGSRRRGRKPVATPARLAAVCARLAVGDTERAACLAAGIGLTSWNTAKRGSRDLRERIEAARQAWARLRHVQHLAARMESQWARAAGQKALPPRPTKNAQLVVWHLTHRVSLSLAAIPAAEITAACEHYGLSVDAWTRQERAFGLMKLAYARRAKIRGEQSGRTPGPFTGGCLDLTPEAAEDDFARFRP